MLKPSYLTRPLIWLSRIHCCRGFGIQSPSDYAFATGVINEHRPYYAYAQLNKELADGWQRRHLGRLYLRLANWRQPSVIVSDNYQQYLLAGCRKARIADSLMNEAGPVELMRISLADDNLPQLLPIIYNKVDQRSVLIIEDLWRQPVLWREIATDSRTGVCFDLYYCGIVMFDTKRYKKIYKINF